MRKIVSAAWAGCVLVLALLGLGLRSRRLRELRGCFIEHHFSLFEPT